MKNDTAWKMLKRKLITIWIPTAVIILIIVVTAP